MRETSPTLTPSRHHSPAGNRIDQRRRRHAAIRTIVAEGGISNQDELRKRLMLKGVDVTQATLSRDIHDLNLMKGPGGYSSSQIDGGREAKPDFNEILERFGTKIRQAMNQLVLSTSAGSAQPVAAGLDRQEWAEVLGTIAGDDTVLIICADERHARTVRLRIEALLG